MPYYEADRTMGSLSHKPPYDHIVDPRYRDLDQLWLYFIHNDLIPAYDPTSHLRTWRMELVFDCHLNLILDDFFHYKWKQPDQVRRRYYEIIANVANECTYGLIAFCDVTHRRTLSSDDCVVSSEWLEDVVLRESSGVAIALSQAAPEGQAQSVGSGVAPALTTGAAPSSGSGVFPLLLSVAMYQGTPYDML